MKKCELCKSPAKLFCESDQASLCWECDARVHTANFLVTKHPRTLLCHVCQSLTAWQASGPKFVPTISVCNHCVTNNDHDDDTEDEDSTENDEEEEDDDDDEDNQVVPWTSSTTPPPPPPVSSSSNSSNSTSSCRF